MKPWKPGHFCNEWDGLWVTHNAPEAEACICTFDFAMNNIEAQRVRILVGPIWGGRTGVVVEDDPRHGIAVRLDKGEPEIHGMWHGTHREVAELVPAPAAR